MKRKLGKTSVFVNPIGLGTWPLSNINRPSESDAIKLILDAIESGVNLIDTADAYCIHDREFGYGEKLIGKVLSHSKIHDTIIVASKVGRLRVGKKWITNGRPEYIKLACEDSLRRLKQETISLYQLHQVDKKVPIEESMGAFKDLQDNGKIQHIGLSNVNKIQIEKANSIVSITSVQNQCNPWYKKDISSGLINECYKRSITYFPWYPFGGENNHKLFVSNNVIVKLSKKYKVSPYQLVLLWLLNIANNVILIPGSNRLKSIQDNLKTTKLNIEPFDLKLIANL